MATGVSAGEDKTVKDEEAPPFHLTERDKWLLSITDEEFTPHTWDDLKEIIGQTVISFFSDLLFFLNESISVGMKMEIHLNHMLKAPTIIITTSSTILSILT